MTVRILAVCGNGQGSSMIMKMKVDQFLTQSNIDHTVNSCAVGEYKSELSGADIIIASTHIAGEITVTGNKYVVGVRNMLSPADFGPKLLEVIKEHFPQDVKLARAMKLRDSLAENKSIRLQAEAETWQDAVKIGVDLLVAADVVEPRYYQAILDAVEQHGPYFVLAPGLAMPHGRPEEGVKKTGFALVTLKKPLEFNHEDNDPVDILITMAAVDANTHQEVGIMQIVNLFEDEENFDRLRACRTEQEVLDLIDRTNAAA